MRRERPNFDSMRYFVFRDLDAGPFDNDLHIASIDCWDGEADALCWKKVKRWETPGSYSVKDDLCANCAKVRAKSHSPIFLPSGKPIEEVSEYWQCVVCSKITLEPGISNHCNGCGAGS